MSNRVKVEAKVHFSSSAFGAFSPGDVFMLPEEVAKKYEQNGFIKFFSYEIKPHVEAPSLPTDAGTAQQSSSLPAAPASPKRTLKPRAKKQTKSYV